MPRHKWREENRWTITGTNIDMVFGWSEHTRNPKHQYTVRMEQWDGPCLVSIDIPCRWNWWPLEERLRSDAGWVNSALRAYWEENLHKGSTVAVRGGGPLIAPSVAKRRAEIAAADAERRAAEKQRHDAACADLAEKAAKGRAEFYSALPLATAYVGLEGRKPIIKIEGEGPTALVTLEGSTEPIEAKWLEGGGVKSLRFE